MTPSGKNYTISKYMTIFRCIFNFNNFSCNSFRLALSEVPLCLTCDFRFLGKMTPKVKIFENDFQDSLTGHRITFRGQIWWKSAIAKLPKGHLDYHTNKLGSPRDSSQPPILPKMDQSRIKFPEIDLSRILNLDLFPKDWFFGPPK